MTHSAEFHSKIMKMVDTSLSGHSERLVNYENEWLCISIHSHFLIRGDIYL